MQWLQATLNLTFNLKDLTIIKVAWLLLQLLSRRIFSDHRLYIAAQKSNVIRLLKATLTPWVPLTPCQSASTVGYTK